MTAPIPEAVRAEDFPLHRPLHAMDDRARSLVRLLASGGDARIALDRQTGLNKYLSGPYPRDVLAYSSSTISDISADAFAHCLALQETIETQPYALSLDRLRDRIRGAIGLDGNTARIVFAPSGTDLEYVALAAVSGKGPTQKGGGGVHNILLGADETGSGCVHSAHGRFFAEETALDVATTPADTVPGCDPVTLVDIPVRCSEGVARSSAVIVADMTAEIMTAQARGAHALVHCVHGSKTGLVLPALADLEALQSRFGDALTFVVDACQARITGPAIAAYLERGCIVLMTGSKFMGAPPFNGWAVIPVEMAAQAAPLPKGFAAIFRRAEWPEGWPGRDILTDSANPSLALRLEAALFEFERFQAIAMDRVAQIIDAFEAAVATHLIAPLAVRRVCPGGDTGRTGRPIEMRTLITLDLSGLPGLATFADAQALHKALAMDGIRLGQPVKCVRCDGEWGGTLRVGISMPQVARWAGMADRDVAGELASDMGRIAAAISAHLAKAL
ncbi:MAG: hypothetical protein WBA51_18220 [Erythrobacter sp.]